MSSEGRLLAFNVPGQNYSSNGNAKCDKSNYLLFDFVVLPVGVTGSLFALFFLSLEGILEGNKGL